MEKTRSEGNYSPQDMDRLSSGLQASMPDGSLLKGPGFDSPGSERYASVGKTNSITGGKSTFNQGLNFGRSELVLP